jgi:LemA protein
VRNFSRAQGQLSASLIPLRQLQENYPDLKTNQNFLALQSQIEGTENRITVAREDYNQAVQAYNTRIRTFPDAIGAKIFYGAKPKVPFEAVTPGADRAPQVQFNLSRVLGALLRGIGRALLCWAQRQVPRKRFPSSAAS